VNNKSDIEALRELTSEPKNQTKMGRLRGLFDEIEKAKEAGVSNIKIVETLNAQGLDINLKTFESMMYKIRQSRKNKPSKTPAVTPQHITPKENYSDIPQNQEAKEKQKPKLNENIQKSEATDAKSLFAEVATKPDEGKHNPLSKKYT
jgi:hypothetical protein